MHIKIFNFLSFRYSGINLVCPNRRAILCPSSEGYHPERALVDFVLDPSTDRIYYFPPYLPGSEKYDHRREYKTFLLGGKYKLVETSVLSV